MAIPAETVYLFRIPLLRDAAYQLQVPSDRARLHRFALEIMESIFGGPPPEPQPDQWGDLKCEPHATDPVSADLAEHVRGIRAWEDDEDGSLLTRERLYLRRAAEYAETQFDNDDAIRLWQRLAELVEADDPSAAAECIRREGAVLAKSGRPLEAAHRFESARSMAVSAGDRRTEGLALGHLALVYEMTGRMEEAERTNGRALAIYRETGSRRSEGIALGNLAGVYRVIGRLEEAERTYEQALAMNRETGDRRTEGIALGNLAIIYELSGRMEKAERTYEQALAIHRETGNRRTEGIALVNLANVYQQTGRLEEAERNYELALAIHRETGNRRSEGITLGNVAILYLVTGRMDKSERTFEQALAIHRETRSRRFEGGHTCEYALCLLALKRADAGKVWRSGAEILSEIGDATLLEQQTTAMREACADAGVAAFDK